MSMYIHSAYMYMLCVSGGVVIIIIHDVQKWQPCSCSYHRHVMASTLMLEGGPLLCEHFVTFYDHNNIYYIAYTIASVMSS